MKRESDLQVMEYKVVPKGDHNEEELHCHGGVPGHSNIVEDNHCLIDGLYLLCVGSNVPLEGQFEEDPLEVVEEEEHCDQVGVAEGIILVDHISHEPVVHN